MSEGCAALRGHDMGRSDSITALCSSVDPPARWASFHGKKMEATGFLMPSLGGCNAVFLKFYQSKSQGESNFKEEENRLHFFIRVPEQKEVRSRIHGTRGQVSLLITEKRTITAFCLTKKTTRTFLPDCMHQKMVGFKPSKSELQNKVQRNSKATKIKLRRKGHHIKHMIKAQ